MIYSDLHCDTLTRCFNKKESIINASGHINAYKSGRLSEHRQCFALFADDSKRGRSAFSFLKKLVDFYETEEKKLKNTNIKPVLTLENGSLLGGDCDGVDFVAEKGVRLLGLTWNGENELACGADVADGGLKTLGKKIIEKSENSGITIDVSHLNEKSFYDVFSFVRTPVVASHSNCQSLVPHKRNLKDRQIKLIIESGGLIGLCFHAPFLSVCGVSNFEMLYRNIFHIMSLGGEDCVCFGGDFDGGVPVSELCCVHRVNNLYGYLKGRGLDKELLDKIFYKNVERLISFDG